MYEEEFSIDQIYDNCFQYIEERLSNLIPNAPNCYDIATDILNDDYSSVERVILLVSLLDLVSYGEINKDYWNNFDFDEENIDGQIRYSYELLDLFANNISSYSGYLENQDFFDADFFSFNVAQLFRIIRDECNSLQDPFETINELKDKANAYFINHDQVVEQCEKLKEILVQNLEPEYLSKRGKSQTIFLNEVKKQMEDTIRQDLQNRLFEDDSSTIYSSINQLIELYGFDIEKKKKKEEEKKKKEDDDDGKVQAHRTSECDEKYRPKLKEIIQSYHLQLNERPTDKELDEEVIKTIKHYVNFENCKAGLEKDVHGPKIKAETEKIIDSLCEIYKIENGKDANRTSMQKEAQKLIEDNTGYLIYTFQTLGTKLSEATKNTNYIKYEVGFMYNTRLFETLSSEKEYNKEEEIQKKVDQIYKIEKETDRIEQLTKDKESVGKIQEKVIEYNNSILGTIHFFPINWIYNRCNLDFQKMSSWAEKLIDNQI